MSAVRIITTRSGGRFAYVGDYTLRDGDGGGWTVSRDIDGDEVRVATGLTLDEAVQLAEGKA
jgi:hypothetical protein